MIRKMLMVAAAVAMPIGVVAATAGTASAGGTTDATGAPATATCTSSGGSLAFKYGLGSTGGAYTFPTKNKGNQITVSGVTLTCTSSAVSGSFTGTLAGKIKTSHPSDTPAQEYACTNLVGGSTGTVTGSLKIKWAAPVGQKFGGGTKSVINVNGYAGGLSGSYGSFSIPGTPGSGSISGSFPGADAGATSSVSATTAATLTSLLGGCTASGGLSSISLASGTALLK